MNLYNFISQKSNGPVGTYLGNVAGGMKLFLCVGTSTVTLGHLEIAGAFTGLIVPGDFGTFLCSEGSA